LAEARPRRSRNSREYFDLLNTMRTIALVLVAVMAAGCAATPGRTSGTERWEGLNRGIYKFNDTVDRAALKPVAKGYRRITPHWLRVGIGNFLGNLEYPSTAVNQFLQGKAVKGLRDTGRFLINTTFGLAGFLDVATPLGLEANDEDFGQTLAVWGVGSGPFVNLPFFGPSSVRDAPARVFDFFSDPLAYMDVPWEAVWTKRAVDVVHHRSELLPLDATLQRTYDPYAFVRDAWVQQREFQIYDGNPPPETLDEEFVEPDSEETPPDAADTPESEPPEPDEPPQQP
jgi:phospholipid-binding lipoprotein MlaA